MLMILIMKVLNFMSLKKITARLNKEIIFALIFVFCYQKGFTYSVYVSNEKFDKCMVLFLITNKT